MSVASSTDRHLRGTLPHLQVLAEGSSWISLRYPTFRDSHDRAGSIEHMLRQLGGVTAVKVDRLTARIKVRFDPARRGSTVFARPTLTVQFWRHAKGSTKDNPTRVPDATYAYFFSDNAFGAEIARKMGDTLHPYGDVLYPLVIRAGVPYTRVGN